VLNVVDDGLRRALGKKHDPIGHFVREQTGVAPDHRDDGNPDRRKDVGRCSENREYAQQDDQRGEHQERVRTRQRYRDDPHGWPCPRWFRSDVMPRPSLPLQGAGAPMSENRRVGALYHGWL
jgi:hypothetical protein